MILNQFVALLSIYVPYTTLWVQLDQSGLVQDQNVSDHN